MDFSTDGLVVSLLLGVVGMGVFRYGKKEQRFPHLVGGVALMVCPYFVNGPAWMLTAGGAIIAGIALAAGAGY